MYRITVFGLVIGCLIGCQSKPRYPGPMFSLPDLAGSGGVHYAKNQATDSDNNEILPISFASAQTSDTANIPIRVIDVRPGWQAQYYNGSMAPQDWEVARTIVPMDNFKPTVASHLKRAIQQELQRQASAAKSLDVRMMSFECVFDMSEHLHGSLDHQIQNELIEFEQNQDERRERRRRDSVEDERHDRQQARFRGEKYESESFASEIFGGLLQASFDGVVDGVRVGKIKQGKSLPKFRASNNFDVLIAPDPEHRRKYPAGLSCRMKVRVLKHDADGLPSEKILAAETIYDKQELDKNDVQNVVLQTIKKIALRVVADEHDEQVAD